MMSPRILLVTTTTDVTSDYVVLALRARDARFFRLNTDTFPTIAHAAFQPSKKSSCRWRSAEGTCQIDEITAIYYRRQRLAELTQELDEGTKAFCARETWW